MGMGGSIYRGYNNSNTPTAEYNVASNVTAAQIMFSTNFERVKILAAPLDTAGLVFIAGNNYEKLVNARSTNALVNAILENYYYSVGGHSAVVSTVLCDVEAAQMVFSEEYLDNALLPVVVNNAGYTIVDYENGSVVMWALYWNGLVEFDPAVTNRLLSW